MEEVDEPAENLTSHENEIEKHFVDTVKRNEIGRFIVRLPFTGNPFCIGGTETMAIRRFRSQESRLLKIQRDPRMSRKTTF